MANLSDPSISGVDGFDLNQRVIACTYNGRRPNTALRHGKIVGFRYINTFPGSRSTRAVALIAFDEGYVRWSASMSRMEHECKR